MKHKSKIYHTFLLIFLGIYKYICWHIVNINFFIKKITFKTNGNLFCFLLNFNARLKNKDVRFFFIKKDNIYFAESENLKKFFIEKNQNYNSYINGIKERGLNLGKEYFLPEIKFSDNDIVIDCGANVGDLKIYFDEKKLNVEYIGIEPSPKEYYCLLKNIGNSKSYNVGLWHTNGHLDFFVSSENADSSFILPPKYNDKIKIITKRLDSLLDKNIKLLKIEAEGAEVEVLMGCERLLSKIDYISADLGFERGVLKESTLAPVTNFLLQRNFKLINFNSRIVGLYKRIE
jgi:FkbM family methyltransferase